MAISLSMKAQYAVHVVRIVSDTACLGDSIKIDLKIIYPIPPNTASLTVGLVAQGANVLIFQNNFNNIYLFPKEYFVTAGQPDSAYFIKAKVPLNCTGFAANGYGMGNIYANNYLMAFAYKNCATGIKENNFELNESILYFDLQGNKVDGRYNELLIEQKGLTRRKIIIQKE